MNKLQSPPFFTALLAAAFIIIAGIRFICVPIMCPPDEDALILFRYAENLAEHGIVSYNPGGAPSEGATDFLWLVMLAGLHRTGVPVYAATLMLNFLGLLATAALMCSLARKRNILLFICVGMYLMLLPNIFASVRGFSTVFFGFCIVLSLYFLTRGRVLAYALASLLTVLVRPDGLIFVAPGIVWLIILDSSKRKAAVLAAGMFCGIFSLYFLWRYNYFGFLMPLPFYIKTTNSLFVWNSIIVNLEYALYALPFLIALIAGVFRKKAKIGSNTFILALIYIGAFSAYSHFVLYQNSYERFQYPFLLLAMALFFEAAPRQKLRTYIVPMVVVFLLLLPKQYTFSRSVYLSRYINNWSIGRNMQKVASDLVLLTTEAGMIPYYTGWYSVDAWGLNSPQFTQKLISPEDVRAIDPDVVLINQMWDYTFLERTGQQQAHTVKGWTTMNENIFLGLGEKYDIFLTPATNLDRLKADPLASHKSIEWSNKLYFCFFLKKKTPHYFALKAILESHGAIPYETYKRGVGEQVKREVEEMF